MSAGVEERLSSVPSAHRTPVNLRDRVENHERERQKEKRRESGDHGREGGGRGGREREEGGGRGGMDDSTHFAALSAALQCEVAVLGCYGDTV